MMPADTQAVQQRHDSYGKSAHAKINVDTHYDTLEDPGELNPDMSINTISVKQHGDDYIRPNADLERRSQMRGEQQLKCMYPECFDV